MRAALIHDLGYALIRAGTPHPEMPTRVAADAVFREALIVAGVSPRMAWLMWAAVRAFGRGAATPALPA